MRTNYNDTDISTRANEKSGCKSPITIRERRAQIGKYRATETQYIIYIDTTHAFYSNTENTLSHSNINDPFYPALPTFGTPKPQKSPEIQQLLLLLLLLRHGWKYRRIIRASQIKGIVCLTSIFRYEKYNRRKNVNIVLYFINVFFS